MELRGFDSYEVTLGDEMRGRRASMGKSLGAAAHDMRLKPRVIAAVENCDLDGFPSRSTITGYVRSYARYLKMDPEDCFKRFCAESGFKPVTANTFGTESAAGNASGLGGSFGADIAGSRFAAPASARRFHARVSLGALVSGAALVALVAGLGYGGAVLLRDIQQVGFAPLPNAPEVVAQAPKIDTPDIDVTALRRPQPSDFSGEGPLASSVPRSPWSYPELRRDGPISGIDPNEAGLFTRYQTAPPPVIASADDAIAAGIGRATAVEAEPDPTTLAVAEPEIEAPTGTMVRVTDTAWIRVRAGDRSVLFEGIMEAGDTYILPDRVIDATLRAGNAGSVYAIVDGITYGPVGRPGRVAKNIPLGPETTAEALPVTDLAAVTMPETTRILGEETARLDRE